MERLFTTPQPTLEFSFAQIEGLVGRPLPPSARRWRAWWANDLSHSHARRWMAAGYRVTAVNLVGERVRFDRSTHGDDAQSAAWPPL